MQAPINSRFVLLLLLVCFACSRQVTADPPAPYTSTSPTVPGVYGTNTANGDGVFGNATMGRGVVGASEGGIGVHGNSREGCGVVGISDTKAGVEGQSQGYVGVWGETRALSGAGGGFHNYGGGDLIRAGSEGVFRVSNNGDVFVRGQLMGATGPEGPQELQARQDLLYILSRYVVVGMARASVIVRVVKLRVRLLALRPQGAL